MTLWKIGVSLLPTQWGYDSFALSYDQFDQNVACLRYTDTLKYCCDMTSWLTWVTWKYPVDIIAIAHFWNVIPEYRNIDWEAQNTISMAQVDNHIFVTI